MRLVAVPATLCVGLMAGAVSMSLVAKPLSHAGHNPLPIPKEWSEAQFAAFVAQSDKNIDEMAGRTLAPGEVFTDSEGLRYWKSVPGIEKKKCQQWCPKRRACHDPD